MDLMLVLKVGFYVDEPMSYNQICKKLELASNGKNYRKIDELCNNGILKIIKEHPKIVEPDKTKILDYFETSTDGKLLHRIVGFFRQVKKELKEDFEEDSKNS